jgi:hypothetical protein
MRRYKNLITLQPGGHMRTFLLLLLTLVSLGAMAAVPLPGSPERLTDWRWLARSPEGRRTTLSGKDKLEAYAGKYLLLEITGPGVLDHLILRDPDVTMTITVDDKPLWLGKVSALETPPATTPPLFPKPVFFSGASFYHLLAPIGCKSSLRILVDKADPWRYLSYRTFRDPAAVFPATADPNGAYAKGLQTAAQAWNVPTLPESFNAKADATARVVTAEVKIEAGKHTTALNLSGGGEITHLEFHLIPAFVGSLRELVVECYYDGATDPALRLPITDLIGLPHPWTQGRWDCTSGTLAAGIHYPWPEYLKPSGVISHQEATFYFNLPIPYANGLRIELVNRSARLMFHCGWPAAQVARSSDSRCGATRGWSRALSASRATSLPIPSPSTARRPSGITRGKTWPARRPAQR